MKILLHTLPLILLMTICCSETEKNKSQNDVIIIENSQNCLWDDKRDIKIRFEKIFEIGNLDGVDENLFVAPVLVVSKI